MTRMALYRAWRSQTFEDVIGQKHITQTLQNSIREGRISHAYLFNGPRGTGKTSTAKIFARAVNCEQGPSAEPCNECDSCKRINAGMCMDVNEFDAASNRGVEEIRDIREKVKYAPTEVRNKVYIIDEVHMLTPEAFNALLKTLEEPPPHVLFILATTEPHKVPATIHSRCQRFDFRRITPSEQTERMQVICAAEGIEAEESALALIARLSDGGMRDALSLLDQAASYTGNRVTEAAVVAMTGGVAREQYGLLLEAVRNADVGFVLEFVDRIMREGKSADRCLEGFLAYTRDVLLIKLMPESQAVADKLSVNERERLQAAADAVSHEQLFRMIDSLNTYLTEMRYAAQPQTMLEVALLKLTVPVKQERGAAIEAADGALSEELKRLSARVAQLEARESARPASVPAVQAKPDSQPLFSRVQSAVPRKSVAGLERYMAAKESESFRQMAAAWPDILQHVKEKKITVHAWLVDGEPVSATDDAVLVAFKNTIHRETTEKPAHKELIEAVLAEVCGRPMALVTAMLKEWQAAAETAAGNGVRPASPEELVLTHDEESDQDGKPYKEEWINEAIERFGEDLVVVKD